MKSPLIGMQDIEVFTTRPDTLFGASFIAVAANHPLAIAIGKTNNKAAAFIAECAKLGTSEAAVETAEKKGFDTGLIVNHPLEHSIKATRIYRQFCTYGLWDRSHFWMPCSRST